MKDALGHGSDTHGGSNPVPPTGRGVHGRFLIQKLNTALAGNPWEIEKRVGNRVVAERTAERMRIDNPNTLFRVGARR
jgi:hypothetical protein